MKRAPAPPPRGGGVQSFKRLPASGHIYRLLFCRWMDGWMNGEEEEEEEREEETGLVRIKRAAINFNLIIESVRRVYEGDT